MFKVPDHQVAGHIGKDGKIGPLIDDKGQFFKPLQGDARGENEAKFYDSFSSDKRVKDQIRSYFPIYHGTQSIEASNGSGLSPHLVLEDVVSKYSNPSLMDIKIGSRTWYPNVSDEYFKKCIKKDMATTTVSLGFRISGFKVYDHQELSFLRPEKKTVLGYKLDDVRLALRKFVSSNSSIDCEFAAQVYGGSKGILAQLLELKNWFEFQTFYHFYSCSILMIYESESILTGGEARGQVKLVDFAHVIDGNGIIDHNFLGGLCSFIKFIQDILESLEDKTVESESSGLENGQ